MSGSGSNHSRSMMSGGGVSWSDLSGEGQWILRSVAVPISLGYSEREVAAALDWQTWKVRAALELLGSELRGRTIASVLSETTLIDVAMDDGDAPLIAVGG